VVNSRFGPWTLVLLLVAGCAAVLAGLWYFRSGRPLTPGEIVAHLPPNAEVTGFIDLSLLRESGVLDVLAGDRAIEENDYRRFVDETGFDYRTDLNQMAFAFRGGNSYAVVSGSFEWDLLRHYALNQSGICRFGICRMGGPGATRRISFFRLRPGVLAAGSGEEWAAAELGSASGRRSELPQHPAWIRFSGRALTGSYLPESLKAWLKALGDPASVVFAAGSSKGLLYLRMDAQTSTPDKALEAASRLAEASEALRSLAAASSRPAPPLAELLASGDYSSDRETVVARWKISSEAVERILADR
jgi:hypothetical protein